LELESLTELVFSFSYFCFWCCFWNLLLLWWEKRCVYDLSETESFAFLCIFCLFQWLYGSSKRD